MSSSSPLKDHNRDVPIRDAACLILVDRLNASPRLLMGRRHASQVFLPNKWVFPGGRVDDDDRTFANRLNASEPPDAIARQAFALAAVRETFEETGLMLLGEAMPVVEVPTGWHAFARHGNAPDTRVLQPIARAITPPGRPRRFDTWFFMAEWPADRTQVQEPDGELLDLDWFTVAAAMALDLPHITRLIVDDVAMRLNEPNMTSGKRIPFYFQDKDCYRRELIDV